MLSKLRLLAIQIASRQIDRLRGATWATHPIDQRLGVETSIRVPRAALKTGSDNDSLSVGYVGAQPSVIKCALDLIDIRADADFIDIGCGKGRAMLTAAEYPFRKVIGYELSPVLARTASRNLAKVGYQYRSNVIIADASQPAIPPGRVTVVFLYNPFWEPLVKTLVKHIEGEIADRPDQKIWIIYYNPVHYLVFDSSHIFRRYAAERVNFTPEEARASPTGNAFDSIIIYESRPFSKPLAGANARVDITIANLGADIVKPPIVYGA